MGKDRYVNYDGLIPILVAVLNNQNNTIDSLKLEVKELKEILSNNKTINLNFDKIPVLYNNSPNPFSSNTYVKMFIPIGKTTASLNLYNQLGEQIQSYTINERENVSLLIEGYTLKPGIYLYSLIVDGNLIDTKQMILTELFYGL